MRKALLTLGSLIIPLSTTAPAIAEEVKVNLNRPLKAGVYRFVGSRIELQESTFSNGSTEKTEDTKFLVEGVLTLTGRNKPNTTLGKLEIRNCQMNGNRLIPSGMQLDIIIGPNRSYFIKHKGKLISAENAKLLNQVLPVEKYYLGASSDGALYNPGKPVKPGATWKIDPVKFARTHPGAIPTTVTGKGRLVSISRIADEQCMDVQVNMTYDANLDAMRRKVTHSFIWILPVQGDRPVFRSDDNFLATFDDQGLVYSHKRNVSVQLTPHEVPKPVEAAPPMSSTPVSSPTTTQNAAPASGSTPTTAPIDAQPAAKPDSDSTKSP